MSEAPDLAAFGPRTAAQPIQIRRPTHPLVTRRFTPRKGWEWPPFREVWAGRELLLWLVWRDVTIRYKQTTLGVLWAVIPPLVTMVVFSVFFGTLAHMPSDGLPYPLFALCGIIPWTYFSTALGNGAQSLASQQHILSKVYFPRLFFPLTAVLTPLVDFAVAFVVLLALAAAYGLSLPGSIVWLPAFLALGVLTATAVSLWLSALSARYRDVRFVIPFAVQLWMFLTPVVYPASIVPDRWRTLYGLNPMVGVIEGFRWALAGGRSPAPVTFASAIAVMVLLAGGLVYFRREERTLVDIL
jgi:lipopolysaccharide transport system permease protein